MTTLRRAAAGPVLAALALACACSPRAAREDAGGGAAADPEIAEFLGRYFATWSAHDIEAYGRCFDVEATIQVYRPDGRLRVYGLREFLESQRKAQAADPGVREAATSVRVEREGDVATAFVRWRLESGERVVTGTDCFLLAKRDGSWLATALLVRTDP